MLIANTNLPQLNGETLKSKSANFNVCYKKNVPQFAKSAKTAKLFKSANLLPYTAKSTELLLVTVSTDSLKKYFIAYVMN